MWLRIEVGEKVNCYSKCGIPLTVEHVCCHIAGVFQATVSLNFRINSNGTAPHPLAGAVMIKRAENEQFSIDVFVWWGAHDDVCAVSWWF